MANHIKRFQDLDTYKRAFAFQQEIFRATKSWPKEEQYALTDQVRRSSRSIGANIAEAWAKRRYAAHFASKLTDSDGELQETLHWIDTARQCDYITPESHSELLQRGNDVGRLLGRMIMDSDQFVT